MTTELIAVLVVGLTASKRINKLLVAFFFIEIHHILLTLGTHNLTIWGVVCDKVHKSFG